MYELKASRSNAFSVCIVIFLYLFYSVLNFNVTCELIVSYKLESISLTLID